MIKVRKLTKYDNIIDVAKLLYQVDDYIYPDICINDYNSSIEVLSKLIGNCKYYSYDNFNIVEDNGIIKGILVTFNAPIIADIEEFYDAYKKAGKNVSERFNDIFIHYYKQYEVFSECTVITSLSVDKDCRQKGYGTILMKECLDNNSRYVLDVISDNLPAINLYKKFGFKVIDEREEYGNQICYIMEKRNSD